MPAFVLCEIPDHVTARNLSKGKRVTCPNCGRCCYCPIEDDKEESDCVLHHWPRDKGSRNKVLFNAYKQRRRAAAAALLPAEAQSIEQFINVKEALGLVGTRYRRKRPYTEEEKDVPLLAELYRVAVRRLGDILCPGKGSYLAAKEAKLQPITTAQTKFSESIARSFLTSTDRQVWKLSLVQLTQLHSLEEANSVLRSVQAKDPSLIPRLKAWNVAIRSDEDKGKDIIGHYQWTAGRAMAKEYLKTGRFPKVDMKCRISRDKACLMSSSFVFCLGPSSTRFMPTFFFLRA